MRKLILAAALAACALPALAEVADGPGPNLVIEVTGGASRTIVIDLLSDVAPGHGGCTRFIRDGQQARNVWDRKHDDWDRPVEPDEVLMSVRPKAGRVLMFDHRLCHDVEPYTGSTPRIIIRGDAIFRLR